jgi:hypothetical protein
VLEDLVRKAQAEAIGKKVSPMSIAQRRATGRANRQAAARKPARGARSKQPGGREREYARDQGGKFAPTNTLQSRQRDSAVREARGRGDEKGARQAQHRYEEQWRGFLAKLPIGRGGGLRRAAKLVREARKLSDEELRKRAAKGGDEGETYAALLRNRERVRRENLKKHPLPRGRHRRREDSSSPRARAQFIQVPAP